MSSTIQIYTEHGDKCVRSVPCPIKENTFWVMFSVHHLVHFNEAQLRKFFNYAIPYRMFYGKGKLSERLVEFITSENFNAFCRNYFGRQIYFDINFIRVMREIVKVNVLSIPQIFN